MNHDLIYKHSLHIRKDTKLVKMEKFSPKMEIINHIDDLIHKVDIEIEETLKKYNENHVLSELNLFKIEERKKRGCEKDSRFKVELFESESDQTMDQWSETTKVVDYLNQVRMRTIEELRNQQKESVENSSHLKSLINADLTEEEKRNQIFAEKFSFQVKISRLDIKSIILNAFQMFNDNNMLQSSIDYLEKLKNPSENLKPWIFDLFTFVTDFYMSQSDIDLLEKLINNKEINLSQDLILDEKMVLICLLYKYNFDNLYNQKFPNQLIQVNASKIKEIEFKFNISAVKLNSSSIDLSNLKRLTLENKCAKLDCIIIDGLSSLEYLRLDFNTVKEASFKNLYALKEFYLYSTQNLNIQTYLFDHMPNIDVFSYHNYLLEFEFKNSTKTSEICHMEIIDLNLPLFINRFSSQTEILHLFRNNIKNISELFNDYQFPNLLELGISSSDIKRLEKKIFDKFSPKIQTLNIIDNSHLNKIDADAFSNLKQLVSLDLSRNCIELLDRKLFSGLIHLESLDLHLNRIKWLDEKIFSDLKNLKKLSLWNNGLQALVFNYFIGLENLNVLNLSCNELRHFDVRILENFPRIERVDLSGNPICKNDAEMLKRFNVIF